MPRGERHIGLPSFGAALVVLMITSSYMQYSLGVLGPVILQRFELSRTELGFLTTLLFIVSSTGSPFAGRLIDRLGARRVLVLPFLATIAGFVGLAFAPVYGGLLAAVAVAGSGMAFANPLSNKLVALHVPPGSQGLLMGIKQSGVQVGATIAGVVMPTAVVVAGLRGASLGTALLLALGLMAARVVVPPDPHSSSARRARRGPTDQPGLPVPDDPVVDPEKTSVLLWWIGTYALLMGSGIASVYAYLPLFAYDELGMSINRAGVLASLIGLIGVASRIFWGVISERLRSPSVALTALAAAAVPAVALIWSSPHLGTGVLWVAAVMLGGSAVAWNAVAMYAVVKVLGAAAAGKNSGVVQFAFFSGFAIGPIGFGLLTDFAGGYGTGWAAITACFAVSCLVAARWSVLLRRERAQSST